MINPNPYNTDKGRRENNVSNHDMVLLYQREDRVPVEIVYRESR